ncbi:hypothetical protein IAU60_004997 [Kwoniella sp. DSM 27419]
MDARSLLRAKKAEARITHPYAAYNAAGVLRCSVCAVPVKQWDAHLLTKQHRTSVARDKAEKEKAAAKAQQKRPAETSFGEASGSKRARVQGSEPSNAPAGLPAGFFSSGSGSALPDGDDDDDDEDDQGEKPSASAVTAPPAKTGDAELDDFLSSLDDDAGRGEPSVAATAPTAAAQSARRKTYKEVIPGQASYEAAPVRIAPPTEQEQEQEPEPEESEQEKRARIEREEKEEIVLRLEEEERAQEDADSRVAQLKARMEVLKKRRLAKGETAVAAGKKKAANGA